MYVGDKVQAWRRIPRMTDATSFPPHSLVNMKTKRIHTKPLTLSMTGSGGPLGSQTFFQSSGYAIKGTSSSWEMTTMSCKQGSLLMGGTHGSLVYYPDVQQLPHSTRGQVCKLGHKSDVFTLDQPNKVSERVRGRQRETDGPRWRMTVIKYTDSLTIAPLEWTARSLRWDSLGRHLPPRYEIPSNLDVFSLIIHPHLQCPTVTPRLAVR